MKLRYQIVLFCLALANAFMTPPAQATTPAQSSSPSPAATTEAVAVFTVAARLNKQSLLDVTETIDYDFAGHTPHAITRDIPINYHDDQGRSFHLAFHLLSAAQDGTTIVTETTDDNIVRLTIPAGTAPYRYQLHYTLAPVVVNGPVADILKFTVTGAAWGVPLNRVAATFTAPGLNADNLTCYTGADATTTANCEVTQTAETATITTHAPLAVGENLSLSCSFPPGTFTAYMEADHHPFDWTSLLLWLGLPVAIIVVIFAGLLYRLRKSYILKTNETPKD